MSRRGDQRQEHAERQPDISEGVGGNSFIAPEGTSEEVIGPDKQAGERNEQGGGPDEDERGPHLARPEGEPRDRPGEVEAQSSLGHVAPDHGGPETERNRRRESETQNESEVVADVGAADPGHGRNQAHDHRQESEHGGG
jgi:hypothetical protein